MGPAVTTLITALEKIDIVDSLFRPNGVLFGLCDAGVQPFE